MSQVKPFITRSGRVLHYLTLLAYSAVTLGPFLWLLSTALKGPNENLFALPPQWLPASPTLANFTGVWQQLPLLTYVLNSVAVAGLAVAINLLLSTLAAYPLARFRFKGQQAVMLVVLGTLMVPFHVLLVPLYLLTQHLGLTEQSSLLACWVGQAMPVAVSGFGILLLRQAMLVVPKELEEAAALDGASSLQRLWYVVLPLIKPSLATLAVLTLLASWGEFLWPSLLVQEPAHMPLPVGLMQLQGQFGSNWRFVAAGTLLALVPTLLVFIGLQRWLQPTNTSSATKG